MSRRRPGARSEADGRNNMELGMEDSAERVARPRGVGFVAADGVMGPATWELAAGEVEDFRLGALTGGISGARCCRRRRLAAGQRGSRRVGGGGQRRSHQERRGGGRRGNEQCCWVWSAWFNQWSGGNLGTYTGKINEK
ncbi:hypothetical protein GQ55_5G537000 [Panicum hallii var. hallii]|uniref:Uncharacterized protein n=1 Tax=Panicum hallii var. hallii TaxID=1504633 RepID=A0A2T7DTA6_9POAL|nr:hypothetical protein GQ55_5G537000 [Panicum hallii var. hallii]